jgi:two-component system response regulator YesN
MYKLMIAEDEALARDAILEMIDFARFGFEVVAVCENGQEAAEAYFAHNPDLS